MKINKMKTAKSFKVQRFNKRIGIVAKNYEELVRKCKLKFDMTEEPTSFKLEDGTEIDEEYFEVLDNNELLLIGEGQSVLFKILSRLETFLCEYMQSFQDLGSHLTEVLQYKNVSEMILALGSLSDDTSKCQLETREDDPSWFKGIDTKYNTKHAVLRNSAENRMRGYLQKFKKDLECYKYADSYKNLVNAVQDKLKRNKYNGAYFDRLANQDERLCDSSGLFLCDGAFKADRCHLKHWINPYSSREDRIFFSTWNFDHVVEKSRSIIPAVRSLLEDSLDTGINPEYLFELLFEHCRKDAEMNCRGNLKLVHIVCHDKNPHKLNCNQKKLLNCFENSPCKKRKVSVPLM